LVMMMIGLLIVWRIHKNMMNNMFLVEYMSMIDSHSNKNPMNPLLLLQLLLMAAAVKLLCDLR
uniref:Uncharacterized protein n=1 Tax=Amphimedon queenslandica TaxID=400682 RepID=A0A1X7SXE1_AMPQE